MHLRRFDSQRRSVRTWPLLVFLATYLGAPVWLNPQMALGDISVIESPLLAGCTCLPNIPAPGIFKGLGLIYP